MSEISFEDNNLSSRSKSHKIDIVDQMKKDINSIESMSLPDKIKADLKADLIIEFQNRMKYRKSLLENDVTQQKHFESILKDVTILSSLTPKHIDQETALEIHQKSLKIISFLKPYSEIIERELNISMKTMCSSIVDRLESIENSVMKAEYEDFLETITKKELSKIICDVLSVYHSSTRNEKLCDVIWGHKTKVIENKDIILPRKEVEIKYNEISEAEMMALFERDSKIQAEREYANLKAVEKAELRREKDKEDNEKILKYNIKNKAHERLKDSLDIY